MAGKAKTKMWGYMYSPAHKKPHRSQYRPMHCTALAVAAILMRPQKAESTNTRTSVQAQERAIGCLSDRWYRLHTPASLSREKSAADVLLILCECTNRAWGRALAPASRPPTLLLLIFVRSICVRAARASPPHAPQMPPDIALMAAIDGDADLRSQTGGLSRLRKRESRLRVDISMGAFGQGEKQRTLEEAPSIKFESRVRRIPPMQPCAHHFTEGGPEAKKTYIRLRASFLQRQTDNAQHLKSE